MGVSRSPQHHVHVIPLPDGMTVEDAWSELCVLGHLAQPDDNCRWATLTCDGDECQGIEQAP